MDDKKKKVIEERIEKDSFWIKVLVITIVIVWASLVTGSWAGHYFVETQIIGKQAALSDGKNLPAEKPKNWKAVVNLDRQGNVTDSDKENEEGTELSVPDFRNIDDPIPGIDDQAIRTLGKEPQLKAEESVKPPVIPGNTAGDKEEKEPETAAPTEKQPSGNSQHRTTQDAAAPAEIPSTVQPDTARTVQPTTDTARPAEPTKESSRIKESTPQSDRKEPPKKQETPEKKQEAGSYDIQMGSFANPENADKMMTDLRQKGYKARVEKIREGDREFYKVKMDKLDSNESAQDKAGKLKQDGFDAIIISH